jgi:hypothetical protein
MFMTMTARPDGLEPGHLWLASDENKTVVSVLAPEVAGAARHDTVGPVKVVSPYPVSGTGPGCIRETKLAQVELHTPRSGGSLIGWSGRRDRRPSPRLADGRLGCGPVRRLPWPGSVLSSRRHLNLTGRRPIGGPDRAPKALDKERL